MIVTALQIVLYGAIVCCAGCHKSYGREEPSQQLIHLVKTANLADSAQEELLVDWAKSASVAEDCRQWMQIIRDPSAVTLNRCYAFQILFCRFCSPGMTLSQFLKAVDCDSWMAENVDVLDVSNSEVLPSEFESWIGTQQNDDWAVFAMTPRFGVDPPDVVLPDLWILVNPKVSKEELEKSIRKRLGTGITIRGVSTAVNRLTGHLEFSANGRRAEKSKVTR